MIDHKVAEMQLKLSSLMHEPDGTAGRVCLPNVPPVSPTHLSHHPVEEVPVTVQHRGMEGLQNRISIAIV